ncbi:hypothetical protein Tco_0086936 [Tanacetum coccineum]
MPIEFVTWINHHTWPILQALPEVYANEGDNGSKEGEDSFYVTGYYGNGCEVIGYDDIDIRNMRPRFMSCVWPLTNTEQILGVEFLKDLHANNMIRIKGNGINFTFQFTLVSIEAEDDGHGYELNEDTWDTTVKQLGLEDRMIVVDHFEEDVDTFYKPYPKIEVKERLAIPSDFLDIHPMHMYTNVLMRHNGYEQMMRVKMERHSKASERTNHVNVFGRWRLLARANGFDYHKLIRFRYMLEVEDLDAVNEADRRYPVFHLC